MQFPTAAQWYSFGRHVLSYSMGAATILVGTNVLTQEQGTQVITAVNQIASGVMSIAGGMTTLIAIGSGLYAAWSASPLSQRLAVAADPSVHKIITTPAMAADTPSDKVVAK